LIGGGKQLAQSNKIEGTTGNDVLKGTDEADVIFGLDGDDEIWLYNPFTYEGGRDRVYGGAGNDTIYLARDTLLASGGVGNDRFVAAPWVNKASYETITISGGGNVDEFDARGYGLDTNLLWTDAGEGKISFGIWVTFLVDSVEILRGGIIGNNNFKIANYDRALTVYGNDNQDFFDISTGSTNKLYGGDGSDIFTVYGRSSNFGEAGNDEFSIKSGGAGTIVDGGDGVDRVYLANGTIDLDRGLALLSNGTAVRLSSIEDAFTEQGSRIVGNAADNYLSGGSYINGREGNDTIVGSNGADTLIGGEGNDLFYVTTGYDIVNGGAGRDTLNFQSINYSVGIILPETGKANYYIRDIASGEYQLIENVTGGGRTDWITGNRKANVLDGGAGDDFINGGGGNDTLVNSHGMDTMTGGEGRDTFLFEFAGDPLNPVAARITDFTQGEDVLNLSRLDANNRWEGDQAFKFIGKNDFTGRIGELRFEVADGSTLVQGDWSGDAVADFTIKLDGAIDLVSADFRF
jgi:Ca2+-binding RTX toxin-like protein